MKPASTPNECLICGAPLEYTQNAEIMTCSICGKQESNNVRCQAGHYVCDSCHMSGIDTIIGLCMNSSSTNPIAILEEMMSQHFCHMHGPEHHIMVGAALITAYSNSGGEVDMEHALREMVRRGKMVPGGVCGNWGACGAGLSTGMFMSIVSGSSPLAKKAWSLSNKMTATALLSISNYGGPRCCKRDSYLAILAAINFVEEHLHIAMQAPQQIQCTRSACNAHCIKADCPFFNHISSIESPIS